MNRAGTTSIILGAAFALASAGAAYSQTAETAQASGAASGSDQLEEVLVTAERRTEDAQKTAMSVTVRNGDSLRDEGRDTLAQALEDVPGVSVTGLGIGGSGNDTQGNNIIIRGAVPNGTAPGGTITGVPATAVYTDGVYEGIGGGYDLERIEVLRGPQGTLYGRSATAGVVASYTRNPSVDAFSLDVSEELGSYGLRQEQGAVNLPLGGMFALRASGDEIDRDGFVSAYGGKDEYTQGRVKLLFEPNTDFSVIVAGAEAYEHQNAGGVEIEQNTPNTYTYVPAPTAEGQSHSKQYWANMTWNLGPATLTYLPAYRSWYTDSPGIMATPFGFAGTLEYRPLDQFVTQELHLTSNSGSKLTWQVGSLYYDNRLRDTDVADIIGGALVFATLTNKETKDWGSFAEATYPITDTTRITAGLRYDYTYVQTDEVRTENTGPLNSPPSACSPVTYTGPDCETSSIEGAPGTRRFYNETYKLRLEQDLTATNLLYGSVSTGFLPGDVTLSDGPNTTPGAPPGSTMNEVFPYKEETLTAFEVGSKNRFLSNKLQLNGDVYYYDYGGYQSFINVNPGPTPAFVTFSIPARMRGLELESLYQLTEDDRIGFNYAYIHAFFVDPPALFSAHVVELRIANIAPVTMSAQYDHYFHLPGNSTLDFHGDARYAAGHDESNLDPAQAAADDEAYIHVGGEWVWDLSLGWTSVSGRYSATAYMRNVANNQYKEGGSAPGGLGVGSVNFYDPRTLGLVLRFKL